MMVWSSVPYPANSKALTGTMHRYCTKIRERSGSRRWILLVAVMLGCLATGPSVVNAQTARAKVSSAARAGGLDPALRRVAARHPRRRVVVIVQFLRGVSKPRGEAIVRAHGGRHLVVLPLIHGVAARMTARGARQLSRLSGVHAVSLNAAVKGQSVNFDPSKLATYFNHDSSTSNLWNQWTGAGIGVAVIDTGIQGNLPDFMASQSNSTSRVIASVVVNPNATSAGDSYGHGTMVAGLISGNGGDRASTDPLFGKYAGAAPDANLISIKASDEQGNASVLDVLNGIQFAIDHQSTYNIRVLNLSLQSDSEQSYTTDPLDAAVEAAWFDGITVVAAAGNNGAGSGVDYSPGNDPYVITVGAVGDVQTIQHMVQTVQAQDQQSEQAITNPGQRQVQTRQDQKQLQVLQQSAGLPAPWSSSGTTQDGFTKPEIYGPGRFITAELASGSSYANSCAVCLVGSQYIMASGTSLATPIVAGAVAVLLQAHPSWTPAMVKGALIHSSKAPPGYPGGSAGLLNANTASSVSAGQLTADQGLTPSSLVVMPGPGGGPPSWSSWNRSSWSTAQGGLSAPWARSSWSCNCSTGPGTGVGSTRSSWSALSWTADFNEVQSVL